ncbi:MAG: glycosyltransferase, partial [Acidobacteriota bacterium]
MTEQPRARGEGGPVDLSVVVPAYNEEDRLEASLEQILGALAARPAAWEVLVVDDGSADATSAIAERYADRGVRLLRQRQNRGKGAALRVGVLASRGARVLLTDADLSTPMTDLDRLWPRLDRADVVLGSRAVRGARITRRQPLYREVMGKVFNRLVRLAGAGSIRDTQCG